MQPGKRLLDMVAIVTGGASRIAAETARAFAMHDAIVVLRDVRDKPGRTVAKIADADGCRLNTGRWTCALSSDGRRWSPTPRATMATSPASRWPRGQNTG